MNPVVIVGGGGCGVVTVPTVLRSFAIGDVAVIFLFKKYD
jgi:hypothetical protein